MKHARSDAPVLGYGDVGTSLLFIFPLFLLYGVGVLFSPGMNGVDFVSRNLFAAVGHDRSVYLLIHVGLALVFLVALGYMRSKKIFDPKKFLPMILEAGIYALTLGTLIIFVMQRILHIDPKLATGGGLGTSIVLSLGAGVYEELVFRLGLFSGGAALAKVLGARTSVALVLAALVSSVVFSAAHHIGAAGDPFTIGVFVYRSLAGLIFAAIYWFRSLGHAVYAHALYDIYVMVLS
jgi:hypothetical protein